VTGRLRFARGRHTHAHAPRAAAAYRGTGAAERDVYLAWKCASGCPRFGKLALEIREHLGRDFHRVDDISFCGAGASVCRSVRPGIVRVCTSSPALAPILRPLSIPAETLRKQRP
jgi:hypothetical protein